MVELFAPRRVLAAVNRRVASLIGVAISVALAACGSTGGPARRVNAPGPSVSVRVGSSSPYSLYTPLRACCLRPSTAKSSTQTPALTDGQGNPPRGWGNPYDMGELTIRSTTTIDFHDASGHLAHFANRVRSLARSDSAPDTSESPKATSQPGVASSIPSLSTTILKTNLPSPLPRQRPEVIRDCSCTLPYQGDELGARLGTLTDPFDRPGDGDGTDRDTAPVENGGGTRGLAVEELPYRGRPSVLAHLLELRDQPPGVGDRASGEAR